MLVVDASALIDLVLRTARESALLRALRDPRETLHAPHVIDLEIANALRRLARQGAITDRDAALALHAVRGIDLHRYAHTDLLPRVWELRSNATAYDAAYLALAEILAAPLLTCDAALVGVPGCEAEVVCV